MKNTVKILICAITLIGLSSCTLARLKNGSSTTGTSIDALRDGETISIRGMSEKDIKVSVLTSSGKKCKGNFKFERSRKGYLGFSAAKNVYQGKFTTNSKECKEAIGKNVGKTVALVHIRSGGILGSSILASHMVYVCDGLENKIGFCSPQNTFKLTE